MDIARAAGVSRTTASAALGGSGRVSAATRDRVQAIAAQMGYVPNPTARHLKAGRTGAIAIYVPNNLFGYPFYAEFAFGAAEASREDAFALTLLSSGPVAHADGIIVVDPVSGDRVVHELLASGRPVVAAERYLDPGPQPVATVQTEYGDAQRELLDHLWDRGARSVALLSISVDFSWKRLIEDVYRSWCEEREIPPSIHVLERGSEADVVRRDVRALLEAHPNVDAVAAMADGTALGVVAAAHDLGRTVGHDLLVCSSIDSLAMRFATPAITAMSAPPREIGRDAARVLLDILHGREVPPVLHRPKPPVVIRESTVPHQPATPL